MATTFSWLVSTVTDTWLDNDITYDFARAGEGELVEILVSDCPYCINVQITVFDEHPVKSEAIEKAKKVYEKWRKISYGDLGNW